MPHALKKVAVTITGKTPLLLNRFTDADQQSATHGSRTSSAAGDRGTPKEQAEQSLYKDEGGKLILPGPNLFACLMEGGRFYKAGKKQITTQKSSMIPSCLVLEELVIPIKHKDPWTVDGRPVRMPSTGGRIIRYRPCFNDWELSFSLELDTEIIGIKLLREIVDSSGNRIGLGDFRPDCKGPYGRFSVTNWKPQR